MANQKKKKTPVGKIVLFAVEIVALIALLVVMWVVLKATDKETGVARIDIQESEIVIDLNEEDSIIKAISGNFNGTVVTVQESQGKEFKSLIVNKCITLKPNESFTINTKVSIKCDADFDECWVYSDVILDKTGVEIPNEKLIIKSVRISKEGEEEISELILSGIYLGEEELKLYKGTKIADVYVSLYNFINNNNLTINKDTSDYKTLINADDKVIVKVKKDYDATCDAVHHPMLGNYLRIFLPNSLFKF